MNSPDSGTVHTTGQKTRFSSAARALVVGLALVLPGAAALAIGEPIPGIDIVVKCLGCKPPFHGIPAPTGADGAYQFKGLAPGRYELSIAGQLVQTISVDKGTISGVLSREPDGKASITFNGQVGVVPDLPSAPVNTTRSNKKAGIAKGKVPPPDDVLPSAPISTSRSHLQHGEHGPSKVAENESPRPTNGGIRVEVGDVSGDGRNELSTGHAPKKVSHGTGPHRSLKAGEPTPDGPVSQAKEANSALAAVSTTRGMVEKPGAPNGDETSLPGIVGDPIPGVDVKLGKDPGGGIVASSKTDKQGAFHFDKLPAGKYTLVIAGQRMQTISVGTDSIASGTVMRGSDGSVSIFDAQGNPMTHATAPRQSGEDGKLPGLAGGVPTPIVTFDRPGNPITGITISLPANPDAKVGLPGIQGDPVPGTSVGLDHDPGGPISTNKTDVNGVFHFDKLPAGKYKLKVDGLPDQSLTVGADGIAGGTVMRGKDGELSIFDRWGNAVAASKDEDKKPGIAGPGDPIPGVGVGLEGDPEGVKITTKTDKNGAFHFDKLPAGKYKLTFPGLPAKSITIGTDGKTGGKVLRDGNNVIVTGDFEGSPARSQATANPAPGFLGGGFPGIGNVMGGIFPGMSPGAGGPGAGPMSPAAGPMGPGGPAGPMGPGAGAIRR